MCAASHVPQFSYAIFHFLCIYLQQFYQTRVFETKDSVDKSKYHAAT